VILLTGFEPFGEHDTNPSRQAVQIAAGELAQRGTDVSAEILPVTFEGSSRVLRELVDSRDWELVVCVGVAGGRDKVSLERVAINVDDARIPDNDGASPIDEPIAADGPDAYFSRLPLKRGLVAVQEAGIPVEVSNTAGTYVCNHVFYELMHALRDQPEIPAGFVHIPVAETLSEQDSAAALVALVETTLWARRSQLEDLKVSAGAED